MIFILHFFFSYRRARGLSVSLPTRNSRASLGRRFFSNIIYNAVTAIFPFKNIISSSEYDVIGSGVRLWFRYAVIRENNYFIRREKRVNICANLLRPRPRNSVSFRETSDVFSVVRKNLLSGKFAIFDVNALFIYFFKLLFTPWISRPYRRHNHRTRKSCSDR